MLGWIPWFQEDTKEDDTDKTGQTDHKEKEEDLSDSSKSIFDHLYWKRPLTLLEDLLTMGACLSRGSAPLINDPDGNEQDYHNRFIEDRVLGEGEFGTVTLVHDMKAADENNNALACKTLRKGVVFKDNTLYAPIKPEILQSEVNILRTLGGQHYCMALEGVYETSRMIYLVTEYCGGGEMMEYVSKQEEDLRTDDVSRIAFQMLDAVNHCAQHGIIHRDIKPENGECFFLSVSNCLLDHRKIHLFKRPFPVANFSHVSIAYTRK